MADIFLSYKKEDYEIANRMVAALHTEGFSVWWDDGLTPKTAWDAAIEHEISDAAVVVVMWTPRSVNSDWVRTEAHYGQDRGKFVPVMMEPCAIPLAFMLKQTVNLSEWRGSRSDRQWRKLLTWIADLVATKPGNANIPRALGAAQPNPFRDVIGRLQNGDPIVDGALVNSSTPAGTLFRDGEKMPVMRIVPEGAFLLGSNVDDSDRSPVEGPQKRVEIPAPFAIGVFPIIVSEFRAIAGDPPPISVAQAPILSIFSLFGRPPARAEVSATSALTAPITHTSFSDAQALVAGLITTTGAMYRLPSEAEWEYACRAGTHSRYSFGDVIDPTKALYGSVSGPVSPGLFPPNAFGLYDMHGNVREWTMDLWHESFDSTPSDGSPATEGHGSMRVVRGGGWCDGPIMLRSSARMRATQTIRSAAIGFRIVRSLG